MITLEVQMCRNYELHEGKSFMRLKHDYTMEKKRVQLKAIKSTFSYT